MKTYSDKIVALVSWYNQENNTELTENDVTEVYRDTLEIDGEEYMVLTNDEADERWEESLDSYLDECLLPQVPKSFRNYFDTEKWKRDARFDGRGHSLSPYNGEENERTINEETYYIYRTN